VKDFKLPPLSPLSGSTLRVFFRLMRTYRIDRQHYPKVVFTFLLVLVASLFQWVDRLYFHRRIAKYQFKEPPLFILGHWRSGTTLLHNLLTQDPAAGFVTTYHAVFPNNLKSAWLFRTFMRIFMPRHRPGDQVELAVQLPQEDEYAFSNLTHMSYYHTFYFPSYYSEFYRKYVRFESLTPDEMGEWMSVYKNMVIRAAIDSGGGRMVLKNPLNTGRIPMLLKIFPDARFVFLIRNPVEMYFSSVKFFTQLFPTVNLHDFSEREIRDMVLDIQEKLLRDYLDTRRQIPAANLIEIRFEDLEAGPKRLLRAVYHHLRIPNEGLESKLKGFLHAQEDYQRNGYQVDIREFDAVRARLQFAMEEWNYGTPAGVQIVQQHDFGH
jgi:omega-hydroxy-beta-dihydromenaquinone-9 sulfotransferase